MDSSIYWHDPFNRFPTWVYHYRHPDPKIDAATRITPWDFIPENWMDELDDEPSDDSWMNEDLGDGYPDPNDW
jgi:hypothetical protein